MLKILTTQDISKLMLIENEVQPSPWSIDAFKTCFQAGYHLWGFLKNHQLVGYVVFSTGASECHLINLGVLPAHQHQGIGFQLLTQALLEARQQGVHMVYLEVRVSNIHAIMLYYKAHFYSVGIRKAYYKTDHGYEDALLLAREL